MEEDGGLTTGLISGFEDAMAYIDEPSIMHWQAVFFGEWVYGLFGSEYAINYPISAVMVSLASLNVVALAGLLIVLAATGGRALMSGLVTADIASGTSKFVTVRLILAFSLLLPTDAGIEELDAFNVNVSKVQANTMRLILMGGGVADWIWYNTGKAMFAFNIGGAPTLRDTVTRSNDIALGFVCNELYYNSIGKQNGESRFYFMSGDEAAITNLSGFQSADTFNDISLPTSSDKARFLSIHLGGANTKCGSITLRYLPDPSANPATAGSGIHFAQMVEEVPQMEFIMRETSNTMFVEMLSPYAEFATRYYRDFGGVTAETLYSVPTSANATPFEVEAYNAGGLQSSQSTLNAKVNASADALVYLAQNLAYGQQSVTHASLAKFGDYIIDRTVGDTVSSYTSIGERVFDRYLSGFVSAGAFWSFYQDFSTLSYDAERYVNGLSIGLADMNDSGALCGQSLFTQWFGSSKEVNGVEYHCEAVGHLNLGFPALVDVATQKGASKQVSDTISTGSRSYQVDVNIWSGFYSNQDDSSDISIGFWADVFLSLFETAWQGMSVIDFGNDGTAIGSGAATRGSLLSGTDGMLMNFSGQNSPYIMLTQLGEGIRDVAMLVDITRIALSSSYLATSKTLDGVGNSLTSTNPMFAPVAWLSHFSSSMISEFGDWVKNVLLRLASALNAVSLILIYALPAIPVIGWTMIIIALIFTAFLAMGSVPFAAVLIGLPKGEGVISPDTERFLSLLYGVFIRPAMTVVGFAGSMAIGYIGMSVFNLLWFTSFFNKVGGLSTIDSISFIIFIFLGYGVGLFFICLYSFRVTSMFVDGSGVWFSSVLAGGALGSNDGDVQAATQGIKGLASQLNDLSESISQNKPSADDKKEDKNDRRSKRGNFNA